VVSTVESAGENGDNAFLRCSLHWLRSILCGFIVVVDFSIVI